MKILELIEEIDRDVSKPKPLNTLIELSVKISISYLKKVSKRIHRILDKDHSSLHDIAIDAIAPLFEMDNRKNSYLISSTMSGWLPELNSNEEALFALHKIISGRIEQHITLMLKEEDPFFARILDSVNYKLKKEGYKKVKYLSSVFIVPGTYEEITGKVIDADAFDRVPMELLRHKKDYLHQLFGHLINNDYFPAIPLNLLVYKLKQIYVNSYELPTDTESGSVSIEIDEIIGRGIEKAREKVDTYLEKRKLTKHEGRCIMKSLEDIAGDLRNGGVNPGLYKYLERHMRGLDRDEYKEKYHNIVEYLYKVMRSAIAEELAPFRGASSNSKC